MALVLSFGMQAEAKKVKLQYQLKAGEQIKLERYLTQEVVQEVAGQTNSTSTQSTYTYDIKVNEVTPAGDFNLSVTMVAFSVESKGAMGEIKYNSATDTVVADFAKSMVLTMNETYTATVSPLGKISDIKAPAGLSEKIDKFVAGLDGAQMQMAGSQAAASAGPEGFRKILEGMIIPFPEGGAQAKQPWELESKMELVVNLQTKTKYELVKSSKESNEIKVNGQITQDPDSPAIEMQGMNITYELLGATEGTLELDPVSGLVTTGETTTAISGAVSVESPQLPSPLSIPITIRSVEKLTKK